MQIIQFVIDLVACYFCMYIGLTHDWYQNPLGNFFFFLFLFFSYFFSEFFYFLNFIKIVTDLELLDILDVFFFHHIYIFSLNFFQKHIQKVENWKLKKSKKFSKYLENNISNFFLFFF